jgi:hypothetical protein
MKTIVTSKGRVFDSNFIFLVTYNEIGKQISNEKLVRIVH